MKKYFYIKDEDKLGPFDFEELKSKNLNRNTLVWFSGIKDWTIASKIDELQELFILQPPPIPLKNTKKFRISIQTTALVLIASSVIAWIDIESVAISGILISILSIISFFLSKGETKYFKAVSLLPLLFCIFCFLIIILINLNPRDAYMPVGTLTTIGTILYIILTIDKIKQF